MIDHRIEEQEMESRLAAMQSLEEIEVGGETTIEDEVIGSIAGIAAKEVEGVSALGTRSLRRLIEERVGGRESNARGVAVEAGQREAILDLDMRVHYGYSIPETVISVRQIVAHRVLEMAGLITKEVNINVVGIDFPDKVVSERVE
jgi:uncharacterized alkaline shock family protein YloU